MVADSHDLAYLAGLIDGEGCIYINSCKDSHANKWLQMRVVIVNTNLGVLAWARSLFPSVKSTLTKKSTPRDTATNRNTELWKSSYHLSWNSWGAAEVLRSVYEFLKIKKGEAEIALRFQDTIKHPGWCGAKHMPSEIKEIREIMRNQLKALKKETL